MSDVSVVVVSYRRKENLGRIISAWLGETSDVWLCDCSKDGMRYPDINYVYAYPDPGNRVRHAVSLLTSGAYVIKADDDIVPRKGIAADFLKCQKAVGPAIMGIHGRKFFGKDYYQNTRMIGSKQLNDGPHRVDFVGVMTCSPRAYLAFDLKGCSSCVEDLFWQMRCFPKVPKFVIPTDKFMNLPESKDKGRLCGTPKDRHARRAFYQRYYLKHYRKK
jgi:hypothetical protein